MIVWLVVNVVSSLIALWILVGYVLVRRADKAYVDFNEKEWHIDKLAKPAFLVRFINAGGLGSGFAPFMLWILDRQLVQPNLKKSLKLMEQADQEGCVPKILCNEQARVDMLYRVQVYYQNIWQSTTLTQMGKLINYAGAYQCLVNHQGLLQFGMNPEVHFQQVQAPIFIVSLPRTGTTILHRTMAHDKTRFRSFDLCDMVCPLPQPIPRWDAPGRAAKAQEATHLFDSASAVYPGLLDCLETMHGFRPSEADEDLGWYDTGLGHMYMDPLMKLYPEYRNQQPPILTSPEVARYRYAWLKMILQIYQYNDQFEWKVNRPVPPTTTTTEGETTPLLNGSTTTTVPPCPTQDLPWLMKDPNHSAYLPQLLEQFPDAKLVFSHRNPGAIVASTAKLFTMFASVEHNPGARGTTAAEWGQETLLKLERYCNGMVEFTKAQDSITNSPYALASGSHRIDLDFRNVVRDIPGTIQAIYQKFCPEPPTNLAQERFKVYLQKNEREKRGNQSRSLGDFHLSAEDVASTFAEYNQLFLSSKETA